jgi:hypothetical protein
MLRVAKWLAVVAGCGVLSACATYDYGYPSSYYYGYSAPYAYSYDYGPAYYGYGGPYYYGYGYSPYYYGYGPSYYVGPSVGFDWRFHDHDHHGGDRGHAANRSHDHRASRNATTTAPTVQRRGVTASASRPHVPAAPVARAQGSRPERPAEQRSTLRAEQ